MALAMTQSKKEIPHFKDGCFVVNNNNNNNVVDSRGSFKFNVDAPVFVPKSQTNNYSFPFDSFFYHPCFPYLGGNENVGTNGDNWIYTTSSSSNDQESLSLFTNFNSIPASPTASSSSSSSPQQSNVVLTDELQKKILKQMEYQFSDMSLLANDNLTKQINKDLEGYVPISAVASTKKIKSLVGTNHQLLAQALKASGKLDVSSDGKSVKRKFPFNDKVKEDLQLRTIAAENLPDDHSHQNIEKIFNVAGSVKTIRICHPQDPTTRTKGDCIISTKLHALVEFQTQESAEKAVELLHDQRDWRKGLRVRCLLRRSPKSVLKNRKSDFDSIFVDNDDDGFLAEFSPYVQPQTANSDTIASNHIEEYYSTTPKKSWNKGRGKARQQIGRGLLAANPLLGSNSSNILGEVSSPRLAIKGPRMPDGTKGFTMGRGRTMAMQ